MEWLAGKSLDETLQLAQGDVRRAPADPKPRIFLFQLLCVLGSWDRALTQLQVIGELDAASLAMVHTYRAAIAAEETRRAVFAGRIQPLILGQPERWIALMLESLRAGAKGQPEQVRALREEAFELAPTSPGQLEAEQALAFDWLADADPRLGPITDAVIDGKYYWVPFSRIAELTIEAPSDLRDLVWTPTHFRWLNGGESFGLIPTRYPGSDSQADDRIKRSARTEWIPDGGDYIGVGQRVFVTDSAEVSILDLRSLSFTLEADN
ncbi:type VI secretion system accessory protein TagJ [Halochromatium glycolicum]|uniref:Virulence protein SciE type n=1 Tax=Halochromatium glycolicum TaxID=85075 RepID=A0AAJ0U5C4_9GAMM|nr:type VI secretion system accessory protein TagJ [Halochromatium glycolicum]MBK1705556.1 virulence protein SciE type [Halochromatium glycolicum]